MQAKLETANTLAEQRQPLKIRTDSVFPLLLQLAACSLAEVTGTCMQKKHKELGQGDTGKDEFENKYTQGDISSERKNAYYSSYWEISDRLCVKYEAACSYASITVLQNC